ncbi:PqqD family protein [bacterium]|nr:PqqD family protein [bacterium]
MNRLTQLALSDEGFVFDPLTGESFTVNPTGLTILRGLKADRSLESIGREISDQFEALPEETERDITDFIHHLRTYHLL